MEMDFVAAFELEYCWMVDFSRIIGVHDILYNTPVRTLTQESIFYTNRVIVSILISL